MCNDYPVRARLSTAENARSCRPNSLYSEKKILRVYAGDVVTSARPAILDTVLGSCVAVCLYDPVACVGGMNHMFLPSQRNNELNTRYGVHAMELLINDLMHRGGDRRRFRAKAFGGVNVLPALKFAPVGEANIQFTVRFLATEAIPLVAHKLGGVHALYVQFRTNTGKAIVRTVSDTRLTKILSAEELYVRQRASTHTGGDVTLF